SMAYSTDGGYTFTKYDQNPVLIGDCPDFRDPKVFWNSEAGFWNMILAAGQEMRIYSSKNLKEWKFESSFGAGYGAHGGVWECPDLMKIDNKWVLICNINPGGIFGGSATQYFVGDFDGKRFTTNQKATLWLDYGKDHYATVTFFNAPYNRRIALAWMSNWQYANNVPTNQFRSANSVPRDLGMFAVDGNYYCSAKPSPELLKMRGSAIKTPSETCEIVVDIKKDTKITLSNSRNEYVTISYNKTTGVLKFDRTHSGDCSFSPDFAAETSVKVPGGSRQLRIFIDRCSIEVFDSEGKAVMTNLVFPSEYYSKIAATGCKTIIYKLKK
ncbi:MAG: glycoside hydrolase family 32 protein, partial [Bacteroidales bacterium]|nr:glycoside hydrolase family 32 protein [Bacteroidales bacterium]